MKHMMPEFEALRAKHEPEAFSKDAYWNQFKNMVLENLEEERNSRRFDALGRPRG